MKPDPLTERVRAITKAASAETAEKIIEKCRPGTLSVILDWYQWLPKGAREKLSLYHLHTLSKRLRDSDGSGEADETGTGSAQRATARAGTASPKDPHHPPMSLDRNEGELP